MDPTLHGPRGGALAVSSLHSHGPPRCTTAPFAQLKDTERLLMRRTAAETALSEAEEASERLGALPKDATADGARELKGKSTKALWSSIEALQVALAKLGNVNKKALDQYASFADQRATLRERRREVCDMYAHVCTGRRLTPPHPHSLCLQIDDAEASIRQLVQHLDSRKDESLRELFASVSAHFAQV